MTIVQTLVAGLLMIAVSACGGEVDVSVDDGVARATIIDYGETESGLAPPARARGTARIRATSTCSSASASTTVDGPTAAEAAAPLRRPVARASRTSITPAA